MFNFCLYAFICLFSLKPLTKRTTPTKSRAGSRRVWVCCARSSWPSTPIIRRYTAPSGSLWMRWRPVLVRASNGEEKREFGLFPAAASAAAVINTSWEGDDKRSSLFNEHYKVFMLLNLGNGCYGDLFFIQTAAFGARLFSFYIRFNQNTDHLVSFYLNVSMFSNNERVISPI